MSEVAALVKAIRAIPPTSGKPWNPRVAVETFVQHALMSLGIYHVDLVAHIDPKALAFVPLREKAVAVREVGAAIAAYFEAVAASTPFADILGQVHAELLAVKGGEGLGQFFTPGDVCDLIHALATKESRRNPRANVGMVYDCCCGAGSLALAAIRSRLKLISSNEISVQAGDIDPLCAAMTALQIHMNQTFHRLPLGQVKVTVGDELKGGDKETVGDQLVGPRRCGFWSASPGYYHW